VLDLLHETARLLTRGSLARKAGLLVIEPSERRTTKRQWVPARVKYG